MGNERLILGIENSASLSSVTHLTDPNLRRMKYRCHSQNPPPGCKLGRKQAGGPFHRRDASSCTEVPVPYANGEVPIVGDYVKNEWEQPGTVLEVSLAGGNFPHDQISVRWDDGGADLPLAPAMEFTLVSRTSQIATDSTDDIPHGSAESERETSQTEERTTRLAIVPEVPPPVVVIACSTCKGCFYWPHGLALPAYCPHCGAKHVTGPLGA